MILVYKVIKKTTPFWVVIGLILLMLVLPFIPGLLSSFNSYGLVVNKPAPEFELITTRDQPRQLKDYRGQFVYLYFGYLNCNGVCQTHISTFFHLANQTVEPEFKIAFITMDAERDSQQTLIDRIESISPKFEALRGRNRQQVQALALQYKVPFYVEPSGIKEYEINHAGFVFLIDPNGQWRRTYTGRFLDYTKMQQDLQQLNQTLKN